MSVHQKLHWLLNKFLWSTSSQIIHRNTILLRGALKHHKNWKWSETWQPRQRGNSHHTHMQLLETRFSASYFITKKRSPSHFATDQHNLVPNLIFRQILTKIASFGKTHTLRSVRERATKHDKCFLRIVEKIDGKTGNHRDGQRGWEIQRG